MAKTITEPWGRQPTESSQAFEAFVTYRDMGTSRSLRTMAEQHSLCERQLFEWSRKLDWQKRIAAWEEFLDRQARNAQAADVKAMKRRQIKLAVDGQRAAELGLKILIDEVEKAITVAQGEQKPLGRLPIKAEGLAKLLETSCRLERLNHDEPESSIQVMNEYDVNNLNLDEQEHLRSLLLKSKSRL